MILMTQGRHLDVLVPIDLREQPQEIDRTVTVGNARKGLITMSE